MRFVRLLDGVLSKFVGFALVSSSGPKYIWRPRYDPDGKIFMWLRDEKPIEESND